MTKKQMKCDYLSSEKKDILIGLLLGDLHCEKRYFNGNASLHFGVGFLHKEYLFHLYKILKDHCGSEPSFFSYTDKRTNKIYRSVRFKTLSSEIFNEFREMFYNSDRKKIVPLNLCNLLTPIGLAYWAMDDGNKNNSGFSLNTHCFSLQENESLKDILLNKFCIETSLHNNTRKKIIYIKTGSMEVFVKLIFPYFHSSMLYKISDFVRKYQISNI